jgi:L-cystine uptake protein TcyP (sodium:dicarboxylate symporter family)
MEILWIILSLAVFVGLIVFLFFLGKRVKLNFTLRVLIALGLGLVYGIALQLIFGQAINSEEYTNTGGQIAQWVNIVGSGFTRALQFAIVPLVFISIISAISRLNKPGQGFKKAAWIIGFLLITTAISAIITIFIVKAFNLSADNLIEYQPIPEEPQKDIASIILDLIPINIFSALANNSVLPIVLIAILIAVIYLNIKKTNTVVAAKFESFLDTAYTFVMYIVDYIIRFTPYGVLAIISMRAATAGWEFVLQLGYIVTVSYIAMLIVFILHLAIMWIAGVNPIRYLKKTGATLLFAFSSRSSSATLPLTIKAQQSLGVSQGNANLAGSFGTCIGQNACAGVYPVTIGLLVGLVQGMNVWSLSFIIPLILFAVLASIGTAGIGGGATNVSLMVLGLMGLPLDLVGILISVDFLIDMGRTAVNVNDGIVAGFVIGKFEKDIDKDVLFDRTKPKVSELDKAEN